MESEAKRERADRGRKNKRIEKWSQNPKEKTKPVKRKKINKSGKTVKRRVVEFNHKHEKEIKNEKEKELEGEREEEVSDYSW